MSEPQPIPSGFPPFLWQLRDQDDGVDFSCLNTVPPGLPTSALCQRVTHRFGGESPVRFFLLFCFFNRSRSYRLSNIRPALNWAPGPGARRPGPVDCASVSRGRACKGKVHSERRTRSHPVRGAGAVPASPSAPGSGWATRMFAESRGVVAAQPAPLLPVHAVGAELPWLIDSHRGEGVLAQSGLNVHIPSGGKQSAGPAP